MDTDLEALAGLDDAALDLLFREARSVNAFTDDDVDPAEVLAAYDLAKWGPTAMNVSPLRLAVVPRGEARERLVSHLSEGNRAKTLAAPLAVVAAADPRFHSRLDTLAPHRAGLADELEPHAERRAGMARTNALLQIGYLVLALRARGLHVGPMGGFDAAGLDADLFAESGWTSLLVLNVGRAAAPGGTHPRAPRLDAAEAVTVL
ncbi:MAG: malonic semialdehyde reductase [Micrococcales bacterium 73-15]|nr:MAG: malonic semialdehyde reductase [Micrococcales bacterium 73-15]